MFVNKIMMRSLGINVRDRSRIMTDIYGSQNENWLHVLEDEENVDDFKVSLDSLQPLWDNIVPGPNH